jgi:hypothetical protein
VLYIIFYLLAKTKKKATHQPSSHWNTGYSTIRVANYTTEQVVSAMDLDSDASGVAARFNRLTLLDNPPPYNPRVEDVDKFAANEMNQMSVQSREQILYDLHGISETMGSHETPEFLETCLSQLQEALDQLHENTKEAYRLACSMNPEYVCSASFRLMFLRADMFDPSKAAVRFAKHFQAKLELFGREMLCKDITQDDLNEQGALKCLYSGWIQELPIRDISGRLVSVSFQQVMNSELPLEEKASFDFQFRILFVFLFFRSSWDPYGIISFHVVSFFKINLSRCIPTASSDLVSTNDQRGRT